MSGKRLKKRKKRKRIESGDEDPPPKKRRYNLKTQSCDLLRELTDENIGSVLLKEVKEKLEKKPKKNFKYLEVSSRRTAYQKLMKRKIENFGENYKEISGKPDDCTHGGRCGCDQDLECQVCGTFELSYNDPCDMVDFLEETIESETDIGIFISMFSAIEEDLESIFDYCRFEFDGGEYGYDYESCVSDGPEEGEILEKVKNAITSLCDKIESMATKRNKKEILVIIKKCKEKEYKYIEEVEKKDVEDLLESLESKLKEIK